MAKRLVLRELEVERLLLRERRGGRIRAILETAPMPEGEAESPPLVRLTLLGPTGKAALVLQVDEAGEAMVFVGHPDQGETVVIGRTAVDLWRRGNVQATLRSTHEGGKLELLGPDGGVRQAFPHP